MLAQVVNYRGRTYTNVRHSYWPRTLDADRTILRQKNYAETNAFRLLQVLRS